jgi:hypothetical protein
MNGVAKPVIIQSKSVINAISGKTINIILYLVLPKTNEGSVSQSRISC